MITEQEYAEWKRIQQRFPTSIVGRLVDERDALRSALARLCGAVRTELEGRSEMAGYDKRVSAVWEAEQAAREVLGGQ